MNWESADHYEVLQVSRKATGPVIRASWRTLVQKYHPDRYAPLDDAEFITKRLNQAYGVLSDQDLRNEHDSFLDSRSAQGQHAPQEQARPEPPEAPSVQPAPSQPQPTEQIRPWVRFWARWIDTVGFSICAGMTLGFVSPEMVMEANATIFGLLLVLAWAPFEAIFLASIGATPGKWLLRVKVTHSHNNGMTYSEALNRSFSVWWRGMGAGVPLVSLVTMAVSRRNLLRDNETSWDKDGSFTVTHSSVGSLRGLAAIASVGALFFVIAIAQSMSQEPNHNDGGAPVAETTGTTRLPANPSIATALPADEAEYLTMGVGVLNEAQIAAGASHWLSQHSEYSSKSDTAAIQSHWADVLATYPSIALGASLDMALQRAIQAGVDARAAEGRARIDPVYVPVTRDTPSAERRSDSVARDRYTNPSATPNSNIGEFEAARRKERGAQDSFPSWSEMKPRGTDLATEEQ